MIADSAASPASPAERAIAETTVVGDDLVASTAAVATLPGSPPPGQVVQGSAWVMGGYVAQAVTGSLFWLVAARTFDSGVVGRATALFVSLQFVNYATAMGLQELLARYHGIDREEYRALTTTAVIVTISTSLAGSALYLSLVSSQAIDLLVARGWAMAAVTFFALSAGSAIALLVDVLWMAERRWRLVFVRLVVVGFLRIPLLALPFVDDEVALLWVLAGPAAASGILGLAALRRGRRVLSWRIAPPPPGAVRYAVVNYAGHLARWAPQFVLPVIVFINVSSTANANFFLAWTIAAVLIILPVTIGRVLLVEGSRAPRDLRRQTQLAVAAACGIVCAGYLASLLAQPVIVTIYGEDYEAASRLLPTLLAGSVPWAITSVLLARAQVRHDHAVVVVVTGAIAVLTIGLALALVPDGGLAGLGRSWLLGNSTAAAVAIVASLRSSAADEPVAAP